MTWEPLCMTAVEWADWQRLNPRNLTGSHAAERPCRDCPSTFATEQRAAGRCDGMPGQEEVMEFEDHTDAEHASRMRGAEANRLRIAGERADLAEVSLSAPCGTCSHAPVCAHRDTLVDMDEVTVTGLPQLPDEIAVTLTAAVACAWWTKDRKPAAVTAKGGRQLSPEGRARMAEAGRRSAARAREALAAKRAAAKEASPA